MLRAKVTTKVMLLVTVPILFEVAAISASLYLRHQTELARVSARHASEVALLANSILALELQRGSLQFLSQGFRSTEFSKKRVFVEDSLRSERNYMTALLKNNQLERDRWARLTKIGELLNEGYESSKTLYRNGDSAGAAFVWLKYQRYVDELFTLSNFLSSQQRMVQKADEERLDRLEEQTNHLLFTAILFGLLLTLAAAMYFNRHLTKRFNAITTNARLLASGHPPQYEVPGDDEFAQLNKDLNRLFNTVNTLRRKEKAILENVSDGICTIDRNLTLVDYNRALVAIWQSSAASAEFNDESLDKLLPVDSYKKIRVALSDSLNTNPLNVDIVVNSRVNFETATSWSINWSPEDSLYYCVVRDSTEKFHIDQMKRNFITMLSHDIRTPVSSIQLVIDLVIEELNSHLSEFTLRRLEGAKRSAGRVISLVNNLLDLEKIESDSLSLNSTKFDLLTLSLECIGALQALTDQKELSIVCLLEHYQIEADRQKIGQVITNLLSNAIKFAPVGSDIQISNSLSAKAVRMSIRDYGPGVPLDRVNKIFERYSNWSIVDPIQGAGAGIGLSLCKWIIEAHGGKIGVDSTKNNGSVFWFELPSREAQSI